MPIVDLTWADWGLLQTWHFCKICRNRLKASVAPVELSCRHGDPDTDFRRRKSLNGFLMALSDQQLVTGPAMIIAALVQRCQISCYEFQVVTSLGFLASTTHLTTLVVLREYLRGNKVVRNIRVIAMVCNLVLLLYCELLSDASSKYDSTIKIQCVMSDPTALDAITMSSVATVLFLIFPYADSIAQLYLDPKHPLKGLLRKSPHGKQLDDETFQRWYNAEVIQSSIRPRSAAVRERLWRLALTSSHPGVFLNKLSAVICDYHDGFLSELPGLVMSLSYGLTQVIVTRSGAPDIVGSENTVDFEQIVPLFLLFLPILAAVEVWFEAHPGS